MLESPKTRPLISSSRVQARASVQEAVAASRNIFLKVGEVKIENNGKRGGACLGETEKQGGVKERTPLRLVPRPAAQHMARCQRKNVLLITCYPFCYRKHFFLKLTFILVGQRVARKKKKT